MIGSATDIDYADAGKAAPSVHYLEIGTLKTVIATDVVISAGRCKSRIFARAQIGAPRDHSFVLRPLIGLSPFILDANMRPNPYGFLKKDLFLNIFPQPGDGLNHFDMLCPCGLDDYDVALPNTSGSVTVDAKSCNDS